ncbi:serine/threonine-protein kinase [Tessaracoccus flavus]|uniref:serine/threonine-protein kinase n=1 Tax=Tessaracoccus flavus TaxID=1610493 RepID=UPI000895CC30|nr:serine/threonine-protein kinase [Tessaracoccus flavus]SDZ16265.1 Serine/threonine protein kinase [Tessaracoccus flavus]
MAELFAGRYLLLEPIGEGGMGTVWRVEDLKRNRVVAAKILRQSHSTSLLRFVREQSLRIHHPHVLMPLGWAGEDDRVLFTMPIVAGGSLATLVGDYGALPPLFVAEILRQIASALIAVHDGRLVHRDVKPANILLDATGAGRPYAYLTDFGIAVELDGPRFTETGLVTGTPGYLAPELAALGDPAPASDAYSLGSVGLHLLTGVRPQDVPRQGSAPIGVPDALWDTLVALTEPDPQRRLTLPDALARLAAPELAWHDDAAGEVEVFDHFVPEPAAEPGAGAQLAPEPGDAAGRRLSTRDLLVFGFFGLLMILGIVLLLL